MLPYNIVVREKEADSMNEKKHSLILSALYSLPIFHIFEKRAKNLKIPVLFLSFIDNGLFILQEKFFKKTNSLHFCSCNIIFSLFEQFGLIIEYGKTEIFHFSRLYNIFNLPPLNLSHTGGPILHSKDSWKYLGFIFNRKLLFHQHIKFYTNKALSTVKCMKMLNFCGNH